MSAWNPIYAEFARANGRTAEEQLALDRSKSGRMVDFMLWNARQRRAWAAETKRACTCGGKHAAGTCADTVGEAANAAYVLWLTKQPATGRAA